MCSVPVTSTPAERSSARPSGHGRTVNTSLAASRRPSFLHKTILLAGSWAMLNGVLNGASTAVITSRNPPDATSSDVLRDERGDILTATEAVTLTAFPGKPQGEFTLNVTLTVTGGSGNYAGAFRR